MKPRQLLPPEKLLRSQPVQPRISKPRLCFVALRCANAKWNGTHGHKQKHIKMRLEEKTRFDGGINLLFHFDVVLGLNPE